MRFLDGVGINAGERLRRHVDEHRDILPDEIGFGLLVNPRQPLAQFRFRLREIGAHPAQRLVLFVRMP